VNVSFDSPDPTRRGGEFRFDWPSYNNWGIGTTMPEPVNGKRVDWVSTGSEYTWGQVAYVEGHKFEIGPKTSYRAGSSQAEEWFRPIERPYLNNNYMLPSRSGNRLHIDVPAWGGSDHVGMTTDYERTQQKLTLYQGSTELAQAGHLPPWIITEVPSAGELPYRLVLDASRDTTVSPYSSTTKTEWGFTSKAPSAEESAVLPLLQLHYEVGTDAAGKASKNATLAVAATHLPGAVGVGTISPVTVEISYDDGQTWQMSKSGHGGRFELPKTPKNAQFVSLRAGARDSAGNAVAQTVIRAFGLR
jgi:hypothetical protein